LPLSKVKPLLLVLLPWIQRQARSRDKRATLDSPTLQSTLVTPFWFGLATRLEPSTETSIYLLLYRDLPFSERNILTLEEYRRAKYQLGEPLKGEAVS
jgi:hypothetical protein